MGGLIRNAPVLACTFDPFGEDVADSLAVSDLFHKGNGCPAVAPGKVEPVDIGGGEFAGVVEVKREGHGSGGGNGVQPVAVAEVSRVSGIGQVIRSDHEREADGRLVLGSVHFGLVVLGQLDFPTTGDGAAIAGHMAEQVSIVQRGGADLFRPRFHVPLRVVTRGHVAVHGPNFCVEDGAAQPKHLRVNVIQNVAHGAAQRVAKCVRVGDGHFLATANNDGFKSLAAHYCAHACASGSAAVVVHDCRVAHKAFPGRAYGRHLCLGKVEIRAQAVLHLVRVQPG